MMLHRSACRSSRRGIALLMVLLALIVATILALSFQAAQSTALPIARNVNDHAAAREVAESAMAMTINYLRSSPNWRDEFAAGQLPANQSLGPGTFTVAVIDGQDLDGDGIVHGPDETDGDLLDDPSDPVTVTVVARVGQVTHRLQAVVPPQMDPGARLRLLFVVDDASSLSAADRGRQTQFEQWNYEVVLLSDDAGEAAFGAAVADADVVYVGGSAAPGAVGNKLHHAAIGVVTELGAMAVTGGISAGAGEQSIAYFDVVDNMHMITAGLGLGRLDVAASAVALNSLSGTLAPGANVLGSHKSVAGSPAALVAVEAGASLLSGAAAGRRVVLPVTGGTAFSAMTSPMRTIIQRSLQWASQAPKGPPALAHWRLDESSGMVVSDSQGAHHGEAFDGSSWIAGQLLNGFDFDGSNDWVQIPDHPDLRPTHALTICAWIKGDSWSSGDNVDLILRKGEGNPNNWQLMVANGRVSLSLDAWDGASAAGNVYGNTLLQTGRWYHVAATWDGTTARIYVDGKLDNGNGKLKSAPIGTDTRPVYIGGRAGGTGSHDRFDGIIDDVRFFNRALTGAELRVIIDEATAADANPVPQLLALYDFQEVKPDPQLVGHWTLDDSGAGGGGLAVNDVISMRSRARIDSYRSSRGPYDAARSLKTAVVATNSTASNRYQMDVSASIWGDAYCGPAGNPSSVIASHSGTISGSRLALPESVNIPNHNAPPGLLSLGNVTLGSDQLWLLPATYNNLTLRNNATITVTGVVTIHCTGNFTMEDDARILVSPLSRLILHVGGDTIIRENAVINPDTDRTDRFTLYNYDSNDDVVLSDDASVTGMIYCERDLTMTGRAQIFGAALIGDDLIMDADARIHLDRDMPSLGVAYPPAEDELGRNHGRIAGGAVGNVAPARSWTGTAIRFDGSNDRIDIGHHDNYLLPDGSLSLWFRATHGVSNRQCLFSKDWSGTGAGELNLYLHNGSLHAKLEGASSNLISTPVSSGTWHHVVLSFGQGGMKLYLNGSLAGTHSHRGGLGQLLTRSGNLRPIALGMSGESCTNNAPTNWTYPFRGELDDVRLYDYVLDSQQVGRLYSGQALGDSTLPGAMVLDTSGYGSPLNLPIPDVSKVEWLSGGGLEIKSASPLRSIVEATKLHTGVSRHGQYTLEVLFTPASESVGGPAPLVAFGPSSSMSTMNFAFAQQFSTWQHALRIDGSASARLYASDHVLIAGVREHVIATYNGELLTIYRNRNKVYEAQVAGGFASWSPANLLALAGAADGSSPWTGRLYRVALYDRGFSRLQAMNVFNGQPPGNDASESMGAVRWIEE